MIYAVIMEGHPSLVKIGKTRGAATDAAAMRKRLAVLQTGQPHPLVCIATCDGYTTEEVTLHAAFADQHYRGEWFHRVAQVESWVKANMLEEPFVLTHRKRRVLAPVPPPPAPPKPAGRAKSTKAERQAESARALPSGWDPFRAAADKLMVWQANLTLVQ